MDYDVPNMTPEERKKIARNLEGEVMAKVLIVAQQETMVKDLKREMPSVQSFMVEVAASGFEAGILAEDFHPDAVVVDFSIGRTEALQVCQSLRRSDDFAEVILIALLPDDGSSTCFDRSAINETFKKPINAGLISKRIKALVGARKELA